MQFKNLLTQKLPFFVVLGLTFVLTSCGSFQYTGYDSDGIYGDDTNYEATAEQEVITTSTNDSNYYKNYFAENSAEVDAIQEESEIFTDIDSYESDYTEQPIDTLEQETAYAGWGQTNSTVTINYVDNGWYGYNDPWFYSGFAFGSYGWYRPWRYNYGYGWNYNWGYTGYYGYGFYQPWSYGYGHGYYGWNNRYPRNSRYAFNNTRRNSLLYNTTLSRSYNNSLSRSSRSAVSTRNNYSTRRLSTTNRYNRTTRSNNYSTRNTTRSSRSSTVTRPTRSVRSSSTTRTTTRSTTPTRSSSATSRSSSSRSSSTARSSSSSSRSSSGSSSSSSSSRRGRG